MVQAFARAKTVAQASVDIKKCCTGELNLKK